MEKRQQQYLEHVSAEDWEKTPESVKQAVARMLADLGAQEQEIEEVRSEQEALREKVNRNSKNSSAPPSTAPPGCGKKPEKPKSGKKRGGQPGHEGQRRNLYPVAVCSEVRDYRPAAGRKCGEELFGLDPEPYRHQIVEIPPISPKVSEHRLHQLTCTACGAKTRAKLPAAVKASGYGVRVVAVVAVLSGVYRNSQRMVQSAMQEVFGISISVASLNKLRQEASFAVADAVVEAKEYIQNAQVVGADETSFNQGNLDGGNPQERQAWLWVALTPLVTFFAIALSRCTQAAQHLLGENFQGILNSDRHGAYNWVDLERRQLCWAHRRREFIKIAERSGASAQLGEALVQHQEKLFELWHRVRDGTLTREAFGVAVAPIRAAIKALLEAAADQTIGAQEKTPWAKTVRTCRQLLKVEPAQWLFVTTAGVEPTNNAAERALRPAVIWRRISFGSQTTAGSEFVARLLTVVTTLKSQKRNVLEFLTQAVMAHRCGTPAPSLLPIVPAASDDLLVA